MRLKVNDLVVNVLYGEPIFRKIIAVRSTGYTWVYPDIPEKEFFSEDSNDEFFECGWICVGQALTTTE